MNKIKIGLVVVVLVIISALITLASGLTISSKTDLSAIAGPDVFQKMFFHNGIQVGGTVVATTTTAAAYTLTVKDVADELSYFSVTPNIDTTFTLMASSSIAMDKLNIPRAGDTRVILLANASTTAAASITLAAGTGVDLQKNEDTADLAVLGLDVARLTFIRKPNTDVMVLMEELIEAD